MDIQNREQLKDMQKAALQGHILSQHSLGMIYDYSLGLDPSPEKAAYWYEKAAYWYEKAALQGFAPAQSNLKKLREFLSR